MNSIVLTTATSGTEEAHRFSYKLTNPMIIKDSLVCLSNLTLYYTWRNIKASYNNNTFSYTRYSEVFTFQIPDGSYSIRDINNYIHFVMRNNNHENPDGSYSINVYANYIYNRVTISVGTDYQVNKSTLMTTLGFDDTQLPISNDEIHAKLVAKMERVDSVLVHCNIVQNQYQQDSSLIYSFTPNASYGSLLHVAPNFPQWREARKNAEVTSIDVRFTDQLYRPLEIEDSVLVELQLVSKDLIKGI